MRSRAPWVLWVYATIASVLVACIIVTVIAAAIAYVLIHLP